MVKGFLMDMEEVIFIKLGKYIDFFILFFVGFYYLGCLIIISSFVVNNLLNIIFNYVVFLFYLWICCFGVNISFIVFFWF